MNRFASLSAGPSRGAVLAQVAVTRLVCPTRIGGKK